jgi:hypothetical protein
MTKPLDPELSPAAREVLDAFLGDSDNTGLQMDDLRENVASALRAAANQAENLFVPSSYHGDSYLIFDRGQVAAAEHLRAIATELGGPVNE